MKQGLSKVAEEESGAKHTGWVRVTMCPGEQQAPQWQRLYVGEAVWGGRREMPQF